MNGINKDQFLHYSLNTCIKYAIILLLKMPVVMHFYVCLYYHDLKLTHITRKKLLGLSMESFFNAHALAPRL